MQIPNPPDPSSPSSLIPSIETIFHHARQLTPQARIEYLNTHCAGNTQLRAALDDLLSAADRAGNFLASHAPHTRELNAAPTATASSAKLTERVGTLIGPYKLLQLIGEGGFGTVFLADQSQPVRRRVALKIIKLGMDTRQVIARFEAERQALALMDHPHIAKVLDGGATESGRPYFVMEYVVGDPITKFADAHTLTLQERLDLFQQVCSAVQHAHTKGIIHRDLKPGNVLVSLIDGKPFAKVIDFGIAKATAQPLTDKTLFTEHKMLIGTPEYMSPEQAEGSPDIDTRTDVYALGVLLYELLTGSTPIDSARLRSAAFDEMRRMIREEEPPAPSMKLSRSLNTLASTAAARKIEPARLSTLIRGELDWIVLKTLEKDRARRYETPNALADDLRRHLTGESVLAAPPSRAYRLQKFVRKNKGPVLTVSAVALALTAGLSVAAWQWREARSANASNIELAASLKKDRDDLKKVTDSAASALFEIVQSTVPVAPGGMSSVSTPMPDGRRFTWVQSKGEDGKSSLRIFEGDGTQALASDGPQVPAKSPPPDVAMELLTSEIRSALAKLQQNTDAAEWSAYAANLALAQAAMDAGDYPEARKRLADAPESRHGWELQYLQYQADSVQLAIPGFWTGAKYLSDGKLVAENNAADANQPRSRSTLDPFRSHASPDTVVVVSSGGSSDSLTRLDVDPGLQSMLNATRRLPRDTWIAALSRDVVGIRVGGEWRVLDIMRDNILSRFDSPDFLNSELRMSEDRQVLLVHSWSDAGIGLQVRVQFVDAVGGPEQHCEVNVPLRTAAILASSPNGPSGLTLTTHDGTRRIVGSADKTVRFYETKDGKPTLPATTEQPDGVFREVAVFRMPHAVTNLQMTGDGTRLIIHLADGSARIWDIRDPEERRKDLQAEWAERIPAGAYLDTLWATDTPDDKLRDAVIADQSLTPLRRLVAAEMLEERLEDDRIAAEQEYAAVIKDQTDKKAVLDAAAKLELPKRVKARVATKVAEWKYEQPELPSPEQVESAMLVLAGFEAGETRRDEITDEMIRRAVRVRIASHGLASPYAVESVRKQLTWGAATSEADFAQIRQVALAIEASDLRFSTTGLLAYDAAFSLALHEGNFDEAVRLGRLISECSLQDLPQHIQWGEHVYLELLNGRYIQMGPHVQAWLSTVNSEELRRRASEQRFDSLKHRLWAGSFLSGVQIGNDERSLINWLDSFGDPTHASSRTAILAWSQLRLDGPIPSLLRLSEHEADSGTRVQVLCVESMLRHRLSTADDATLAAAAEIDGKPNSLTSGKVLDREGHRTAAREALTKARALMAPAPDGTPSKWANDEDAKALLAEAAALIEGAAKPSPEGDQP